MLRGLQHLQYSKCIHYYPSIQRLHHLQYCLFTEKLQLQKELVAPEQPEIDKKEVDSSSFDFRKTMSLYKILSKWNLSLLNGVVSGSTAFICSGGVMLGCCVPATIGCISLAMSASSLNQIQEYKYDKLMQRTAFIRPLCNHKLTKRNAQIWSALSLMIGVSTLSIYCGNTAAIIGISTLFMYNAVYTPLKRITPFNTEFGAIVGALPPQIGIAASHYQSNMDATFMAIVSDTLCDPLCWYSFALLYIWQMPHFLYLSLRNKHDYIRGGFKMLSAYDHGDILCKRKSLIYTVMLLPLPLLLSYSNITSAMFVIDGSILNCAYLLSVYKWYNSKGDKAGKSSFRFNLLYLPSILFLIALHSKRWKYEKGAFCTTHLAYLQDKGIQLCLYDHNNEYEPSELPPYIVSCTSPFRNEIHQEKPVETLTINDD